MKVKNCKHSNIGNLEFDADELAAALSDGTVFWGFAECLDCGTPVDFEILRGIVAVQKDLW
jgi:hypothetical protein